jgi:hypothetical protein
MAIGSSARRFNSRPGGSALDPATRLSARRLSSRRGGSALGPATQFLARRRAFCGGRLLGGDRLLGSPRERGVGPRGGQGADEGCGVRSCRVLFGWRRANRVGRGAIAGGPSGPQGALNWDDDRQRARNRQRPDRLPRGKRAIGACKKKLATGSGRTQPVDVVHLLRILLPDNCWPLLHDHHEPPGGLVGQTSPLAA